MAVARLERLSYRYPEGAALALSDVTLDFAEGVTLVSGPSGGGKSTLLRVLGGLVPHFHGGTWSGHADVAGLDVLATPTRLLARRVGFVFQDPERQAVAATVRREVAFPLENVGLPVREIVDRVDEALDRAGAAHLAARRLAELSGGERQRVEIAAAMALRPQLLVIDEPTSQLDAGGAAAVGDACRDLAAAGLALVIADHRFDHLPPGRGIRVAGGSVADGDPEPPPPPAPRQARPGEAVAWSTRGLVAGVGGRPVVEVDDLAGHAGEVVVLTGPNGGGKTTLLRTLAGFERPLAGRVERRPGRAAYLPQDPAALLHRPTVLAEVEYTLRLAGRDAAQAADALDAFHLRAVAERYPRDLSGGQRERAALAAVLAGSPAVALLDEPTRGMDVRARDQLIRALDELAAAGAAIVVATHDEGLMATADRVLEVGGGRVVERARVPA